MRRILLRLALLMLCATSVLAHERWSKVRIHVPDAAALHRLIRLGVEFEGSHGKPGGPVEGTVSGDVLARLRSEGLALEVLIEDLTAYYASRLEPGPVNVLGFGYGSMGGYYTLSEIGQQLDSLRHIYPTVVGARDSIGASLQGRPIWAVRMTADPDAPSNRPQVLYFAMQHPREPMGMMTLLFFMWYLAEHYGQDKEVTYLLQNRDLWFIPIVNVDGYESNRRMAPNGGGMRYKNMRDAVTDYDQRGVNLNCNWGAEWGYDDIGSSPNPVHSYYRGTGPFSEPETQALRDFYKSKAFRFVMEFHTYWNVVFGVPAYTVYENADSLLFRSYIRELTRYNHYANGMSTGTYPVNGSSSDWLYENPPSLGPAYPFLTEVGGFNDGDWPPTSRILPLASENLGLNLFSAWAGGANARLQSSTLDDSSGDGDLEPSEPFLLKLRMHNFGQDPTTNTSVSASSSSLLMSPSPVSVTSLAPNRDTTITIQGRVPATAQEGYPASIVVTVKPGGEVERRDTVQCVVGRSSIVFADGAEETPMKWFFAGGWGLTHVSHTGKWSFTDSPAGKYSDNENAAMTLLTPVHIREAAGITQLQFWSRWDADAGSDFGQVSVSTDGGGSWIVVYGEHASLIDKYTYTGWQPEWIQESIDLGDLMGKNVLLKFRFTSDRGYNGDGWFLDDITIRSYPMVGSAYAHDVAVASLYVRPGVDTVAATLVCTNPNSHSFSASLTVMTPGGALVDSAAMFNDGLHGDALPGDSIWGARFRAPSSEGFYALNLQTRDNTIGLSRIFPMVARFYTAGPLTVDSIEVTLSDDGSYSVTPYIKNNGTSYTITGVSVTFGCADSWVTYITPRTLALPSVIPPGGAVSPIGGFYIYSDATFPGYFNMKFDIASNGYVYSTYSRRFTLTGVGVREEALPVAYGLDQNYPNPFNPSTTIKYELPRSSDVRLSVFDILGREVSVLVNERKGPGSYEVRFDASGLASGVYLYRLTAGNFVQSKKLMLVR